jgi:6,7-dimethyl-8-ribityllumazine synthase
MPNTIDGQLKAKPHWKVAILISRFNELITGKLLGGAIDYLERSGVKDNHIDVIWVPGAFELPAVAARVLEKGNHQGIICLGAVIRGSTSHYDIVAGESAKGLASLSQKYPVPVMNAILTTDTIEQALERAGTKAGNKGFDAAMGLVEMMSLYEKIEST